MTTIGAWTLMLYIWQHGERQVVSTAGPYRRDRDCRSAGGYALVLTDTEGYACINSRTGEVQFGGQQDRPADD